MATKRVGGYEFREDMVLGTGSDGVVYLGTCTDSITHVVERVAIKKIDRGLLSQRAREHLATEIRVLQLLHHSNIVQLRDVIDELDRNIYLVLEYVPGQDLFEYIQSRESPLLQSEAVQIMAQAVSAVGYCHARGIVHHDICLENLMVRMEANVQPPSPTSTRAVPGFVLVSQTSYTSTTTPRIQLIDFGFCEEVQPGKLLERFSGSEPYAAPELFEGDAYEGLPIDVWSLGVVLYVLMRGRFPFDPSDMDLHYDQATDPDYLSALLSDFDHPAEAQVLDLLRRMLDPNPRTRITMSEVQAHPWFDALSLNSSNSNNNAALLLSNSNITGVIGKCKCDSSNVEVSMRSDLMLGVADFVASGGGEGAIDKNGNVAVLASRGNDAALVGRVRTTTEAS